MRVCRVREFKDSMEITISLTSDDCENLSHAIPLLNGIEVSPSGYPEKKKAGIKLLRFLDNYYFWTHWDNNFRSRRFAPVRG